MATQKKKTTTKKTGTKKTTTKGGHEVTFALPARELANADLTIVVRTGGKTLGTLCISRGGLDWYPKSAKTGREFAWEKLAELLNNARE
jgi:hypothetical protein